MNRKNFNTDHLRFSISYLALAILLLPLGGCVPAAVIGVMGGTTMVASSLAEERGMSGVISDATLKSKITDKLNSISYDLANQLLFAVYQRQILLTGTVENTALKRQAESVLWDIAGVEAIYNEIQIGPMTSMGQITKDSLISTQFKTQLLFSKKVMSINYEYVTHEGIVYLVGVAQNQAELDEVIHIARTINGVKKVVNHIKLKNQFVPRRGKPDHKLTTKPANRRVNDHNNQEYDSHRTNNRGFTHQPSYDQPNDHKPDNSQPIPLHNYDDVDAVVTPSSSPYYMPSQVTPIEPLTFEAEPDFDSLDVIPETQGPNTNSAFND